MGTFVYRNGKIVPKDEAYEAESGPQIMRDISEYKSMITGETIGSRSTHRAHLRQHNCVEVGSDTSHTKSKPAPVRNDDRKRVIASLLSDKSDRQINQMIRHDLKNRSQH